MSTAVNVLATKELATDPEVDAVLDSPFANADFGFSLPSHLAANSQSEQPALEPPAPVGPAPIDVQSIAQIPAVDFQVDAPSAPKEIDCVVWTSRIKNPA